MKLDIILVPVDGTDVSDLALDTAKKMAAKFNSKIVVLNAVDFVNRGSIHESSDYDPVVQETLQKRGNRILEDTNAKLQGFNFETIPALGHAGDAIITYCENNEVDLIIMATRSATKIRRFVIGSVTNYVIHHTKVPVLAIPVE